MDHIYTHNYIGISGGIESNSLLLSMLQLQEKYNGTLYLEYVVIDDNMEMKKYLTHPKYCPTGKLYQHPNPTGTPTLNITLSVLLMHSLNSLKERKLLLVLTS